MRSGCKTSVSLVMTIILAMSLLVVPAVAKSRPNANQTMLTNPSGSSVAGNTPWYKSRTAKIVGAGTGAGLVIGALAGGGKGAAIGAITGGAAGYIYDRSTRNKK